MIEPAELKSPGLLSKAASGDAAAARQLLDETGDYVYGFVYARVGGRETEAQDITQSTYAEAFRSASGFRGDSSLTTWLCAIARRQLARHFEAERKREIAKSRLTLIEGERIDHMPDTEADVVVALGEINALHRRVLVLKYLDGLSVTEIANELKRTPTSVQSLLQRARDALREALKEIQ